MSIYFSVTAEVNEQPFVTCDLGNCRAFRSILRDEEDYCGCICINREQLLNWLRKAYYTLGMQTGRKPQWVSEIVEVLTDLPNDTRYKVEWS